MTKYKLVPLDPTPEMTDAAADAYMPFGDMEMAIRMALLTAPDVEQKPAGYVRLRTLEALRSGKACGITIESEPDAHNGATVPLYLHPQPAPEVARLVEALEEIEQWTGRWCADDHPVAKFARAALAAYHNKGKP